MQREILLKNKQAEARGTQQLSDIGKRSQEIAAWTAFNLTVYVSLDRFEDPFLTALSGYGTAFMQPPMIDPLPSRTPMSQRILDEIIAWFPYPQRSPEVIVHFDDLHQAYCSLHGIGYEIQKAHFGNKPTKDGSRLRILDDELREWRSSLPYILHLGADTALTNPPIMDLQYVFAA